MELHLVNSRKFFLDVIRRAFRNTKLVKGMNLLRATNNMVDKIEE